MMRFIPPMALLVIVLALCRGTKHIGARDARWRGKMPVSIALTTQKKGGRPARAAAELTPGKRV